MKEDDMTLTSKLKISAAALATLTAAPAFAGGLAEPVMDSAPAPVMAAPARVAPVSDWTGLYAGAQLGRAFTDDSGIFQLMPSEPNPDLEAAFAPGFSGEFRDGGIGGVHVGYDMQAGNLVYGGVFDINATNFSDVQQGFSTTPATYTIERSMDYLGTLRGRVGFLPTDNILVYGTGGLAFGEVNFAYEQPGSTATTTTLGGQDNNFGYAVGAGVETRVTSNISVGLEYLYVNMGGNDFTAELAGGPFSAVEDSTIARGSDNNFDFNVVQAKVSYRF
jgi:outer membrane immunogenic protein